MEEKKVRVPAVSCGHCVATIEQELGKLPGVASVKSNAKTKQVTVRWQAPATWPGIAERLTQLGYPPEA